MEAQVVRRAGRLEWSQQWLEHGASVNCGPEVLLRQRDRLQHRDQSGR